MELCDLHAHSVFSDGTNTPAELIALAREAGLRAVALTDHNNIGGLEAFVAAAEGTSVQAVPGIEFSTDYEGTELHILGLWIRPEYYKDITERMDAIRIRKEQANRALVQRLCDAGYDLDYEAMRAATPDGYINRAHMGAQLTERGYTASVQEAFSRLLSVKAGYYRPPKLPDSIETVGYIKSMGAVAVLAHPFLNLDEPRLRAFLKLAIPAGLDGMEVLYSMYDPETTEASCRIAAEFGILPSGGSDHHGGNKPHIRLGKGRGALAIPMDFCRALEEKCTKSAII